MKHYTVFIRAAVYIIIVSIFSGCGNVKVKEENKGEKVEIAEKIQSLAYQLSEMWKPGKPRYPKEAQRIASRLDGYMGEAIKYLDSAEEEAAGIRRITDKKELECYKDTFSDYGRIMGYNQARIKEIGNVYEIKVKNYRYDVKDFKNQQLVIPFKNPQPPDTFIYVGHMIIEAKLLHFRNEKGEIPWATVLGCHILRDELHEIDVFRFTFPLLRGPRSY